MATMIAYIIMIINYKQLFPILPEQSIVLLIKEYNHLLLNLQNMNSYDRTKNSKKRTIIVTTHLSCFFQNLISFCMIHQMVVQEEYKDHLHGKNPRQYILPSHFQLP